MRSRYRRRHTSGGRDDGQLGNFFDKSNLRFRKGHSFSGSRCYASVYWLTMYLRMVLARQLWQ